ncbi:Cytidylyltransferase, partial [Globisporangium splendens]
MVKKLMKLSAVGMSGGAPVAPLGTSSVLAIVAGVATLVGLSTLHKHRAASATSSTGSGTQVAVGLLSVHVPQNFRDLVKNDVLLEKAIANVAKTLIIYVSGRDKHEIVNYTSELYCLVWDIACLQGKPLLDIRIVGGFSDVQSPSQSWEDLVLLPELNAVFGEDALVDVQRLNAQRFEKDGLFAVTYHPLSMHIARRLSSEFKYFENEHTDLKPHDMVILGGTFDHLHNGHKKLLSLAAGICARKMIIGVTADAMLTKKSHAELIEPLEKRKRNVRDYVAFLKPHLVLDIVTIDDAYGPAIVIPEAAAIVVSTETILGASKINTIRVERGLPKVHIYVCRRTESSTLSSSYIRERLAKAAAAARA